jgi:hypothetical protein
MSANGWTRDATMRYLNANPLPASFRWTHRDGGERAVQPSHRLVTGYGKWLRETPYFQGLFELIHDLLEQVSEVGDGEWLAAEIMKRRTLREQEKLPLGP